MLKRENKYNDILYNQDDFISVFRDQKSVKKTKNEQFYLDYLWCRNFESVYFTYSWWRKSFFTIPELASLVQQYDKAEIEFSKNPDDDKVREQYFLFFEQFIIEFDQVLETLHSDLFERSSYYYAYYVWRYYTAEAVKLVWVIIDSETVYWNHFCFALLELISRYSKKNAFKAYEKIAKKIVHNKEINYKFFKSFFLSYSKIKTKLKANLDIKILRIFWSKISSLHIDKQSLKIFEWLCS